VIANTVTPLDPRPRDEGDPGPAFSRETERTTAPATGRAGDAGQPSDDGVDLDDLPF
jgi:hypothetical protein